MALFSHRVGQVKRSRGQTAAGSLAYCFGVNIKNERTGKTHYYAYKAKEVVYTDMLLPEHAPPYWKDVATFANVVEKRELRSDAQLLRKVFFALPRELNTAQQIDLVKEIAQTAFVKEGMCAALSIHNKQDGNPHCHMLLSMREIEGDHFGKKVRAWNDKQLVNVWMHTVAELTNQHLEKAGSEARISERSYEEQGIDQTPTVHLGRYAHQLKLQGLPSELDTLNQQIIADNVRRAEIKQQLAALEAVLQEALYQQKVTEWEAFSRVVLAGATQSAERVRLQRLWEASHRRLRNFFKPNGSRVKTKKDWQSKRLLHFEQSVEKGYHKKLERVLQGAHKAKNVSFSDERDAEKERLQQDTPSGAELQPKQGTSYKAKRELFKPNGWRVKAKKHWQSVRVRRKEQLADVEARSQAVGGTQLVPLTKKQEDAKPEKQERLSRFICLVTENRERLSSLRERLTMAARSSLAKRVKQLEAKYQGVCEKVVCLDTIRRRAHSETERTVDFTQVEQALAQQTELLSAIREKVAATTIRQEIPETIRQQLTALYPEEKEEHTRHTAVVQRGEQQHGEPRRRKVTPSAWTTPQLRAPLLGNSRVDFPCEQWERQLYPAVRRNNQQGWQMREEQSGWRRSPRTLPREQSPSTHTRPGRSRREGRERDRGP